MGKQSPLYFIERSLRVCFWFTLECISTTLFNFYDYSYSGGFINIKEMAGSKIDLIYTIVHTYTYATPTRHRASGHGTETQWQTRNKGPFLYRTCC